jgi:hypothetical protein
MPQMVVTGETVAIACIVMGVMAVMVVIAVQGMVEMGETGAIVSVVREEMGEMGEMEQKAVVKEGVEARVPRVMARRVKMVRNNEIY